MIAIYPTSWMKKSRCSVYRDSDFFFRVRDSSSSLSRDRVIGLSVFLYKRGIQVERDFLLGSLQSTSSHLWTVKQNM